MSTNAAFPFRYLDWSAFEPLMNLPIAHTFLPWGEPTFVLVRQAEPTLELPLQFPTIKALVRELPGEVWAEPWEPEHQADFPTITLQAEGIATGHCYFPWESWQPRYCEPLVLAAIHHAVLFHCLEQGLPMPAMYRDRLKELVFLLPPDPKSGFHWLRCDGEQLAFHHCSQFDELAGQLASFFPMDLLLELPSILSQEDQNQDLHGWILHPGGIASWEALPLTFPHTPPLPIQASRYWWEPKAGQVIYQSANGYGPVFQCLDRIGEFCRTSLRDLLQVSPYSPFSGSIALLPFELLRMRRSVCRYFPDTPILRPRK